MEKSWDFRLPRAHFRLPVLANELSGTHNGFVAGKLQFPAYMQIAWKKFRSLGCPRQTLDSPFWTPSVDDSLDSAPGVTTCAQDKHWGILERFCKKKPPKTFFSETCKVTVVRPRSQRTRKQICTQI